MSCCLPDCPFPVTIACDKCLSTYCETHEDAVYWEKGRALCVACYTRSAPIRFVQPDLFTRCYYCRTLTQVGKIVLSGKRCLCFRCACQTKEEIDKLEKNKTELTDKIQKDANKAIKKIQKRQIRKSRKPLRLNR